MQLYVLKYAVHLNLFSWQRAKEAVAIEDLKNPLRKSQVKSKFKVDFLIFFLY